MSNLDPLVPHPAAKVLDELKMLVGVTGDAQAVMRGFRIAVHHTQGFPWDEVFKALLYRDYQVTVTRHKADLFIHAEPPSREGHEET